MLMSEGKIAPANLVYAGHFSGMRVLQELGIAVAKPKMLDLPYQFLMN